MSRLASKRYLEIMTELLVFRLAARDKLPDEEEARWMALLDEQWWAMTDKEQKSVEKLLKRKRNLHGKRK